MANDKMTVGNVSIISISDGTMQGVATDDYPDSPVHVWQCGCSVPSSAPKYESNFGSFLVRSGGRSILVDTGVGPLPLDDSGSDWGHLLENFEAQGLDVNEVDTVFMTHMHFDHIGWNLRGSNGTFTPTFPKAKYLANIKDWNFFRNEPDAEEKYFYNPPAVEPLDKLGLLELMEDEFNLTDELTAIPTPGHTPGHMSILVSSQGEKGLIMGDVAHHPLQVHETQWTNTADVDSHQAKQTREAIMKRLEDGGLKLAAGHFPAPGFGTVVRLEGKRVWQAL
jgi:glyoxylase-like metal-dependent hydrolase (beta-lactamase superfamily II)